MERDKKRLENELEKQRQTIGKQVFLQVVQKKNNADQLSSTSSGGSASLTMMTNGKQEAIAATSIVGIAPVEPTQPASPPPSINNFSNKSSVSNNSGGPGMLGSPASQYSSNLQKETPRRQWDKSKKNFDIENENEVNASLTSLSNHRAQQQQHQQQNNNNSNSLSIASPPSRNIGANHFGEGGSTSSLSTPTSSASQSPPMANNTNENSLSKNLASPVAANDVTQGNSALDLTKAYYTRNEVIKALSRLNEKHGGSESSTSSVMEKEIDMLNKKLTELQNEITRLTLLQHNQEKQQHLNAQKFVSRAEIQENSSLLMKKQENKSSSDLQSNLTTNDNNSELTQPHDGAFFISFGSGTAKREKPPALTPKKNLIFIKSKSCPLCRDPFSLTSI